jgi:hypothetical protein
MRLLVGLLGQPHLHSSGVDQDCEGKLLQGQAEVQEVPGRPQAAC